jgi:flagellar biosynthesis chaperone FliJ
MARLPDYRLQALYDMRERAKKDAEDAYAKEQQKVAAEEKKLKEMEDTLEQMKTTREQKRTEYADAMRNEMLNIEKIQINNRHIDMLKEKEVAFIAEIAKQEDTVQKAKDAAEEAKQKMLKATQDFKALEKHREKWLKGVKNAMEQKEEGEVEDISQAQYFARTQAQKEDE